VVGSKGEEGGVGSEKGSLVRSWDLVKLGAV
jgi:hypothetical protein